MDSTQLPPNVTNLIAEPLNFSAEPLNLTAEPQNFNISASDQYFCSVCRERDYPNLVRVILNVHVGGPLCLLGLVGNSLAFTALGLDHSIGESAKILLRAMAASDNVSLVTCLFIQTLFTVYYYTDWMPGLELLYPSAERYIWPVASAAQTTTVWLLTIVTVVRYHVISQSNRMNIVRIKCTTMRRVVVATVVMAIAFNVPIFFEYSSEPCYEYNYCMNDRLFLKIQHSTLRSNPTYFLLYHALCYLLLRLLIPLSALIVLNVRLISLLRRELRFPTFLMTHKGSGISTSTTSGRRHSGKRKKRCASGRESTHILLIAMITVFLVCQLPDAFFRVAITARKLSQARRGIINNNDNSSNSSNCIRNDENNHNSRNNSDGNDGNLSRISVGSGMGIPEQGNSKESYWEFQSRVITSAPAEQYYYDDCTGVIRCNDGTGREIGTCEPVNSPSYAQCKAGGKEGGGGAGGEDRSDLRSSNRYDQAQIVTNFMLIFNASVNCLVYCFARRRFRVILLRLVGLSRHVTHSQSSTSSSALSSRSSGAGSGITAAGSGLARTRPVAARTGTLSPRRTGTVAGCRTPSLETIRLSKLMGSLRTPRNQDSIEWRFYKEPEVFELKTIVYFRSASSVSDAHVS